MTFFRPLGGAWARAGARVAARRPCFRSHAFIAPMATLLSAASLAQTDRAAPAQGAGDEASQVKSLGVVVVKGGRPTSLPSQIPTTIEGITGAQIEATINATDSEDALKYFPSLLVRKRYIGDYNHAVLSTRASGTGNSARSLVYADGILLSNLLGNGATFTPRWGLVTPEEIERVDVLYGPFSAAYPGNSVGAIVDFQTRMPTQFEAHVKVGAFTQPFELYNTKATYSGWQSSASLGDRSGALSWWLNMNRLDSESQPLVFATKLVSSGTTPGPTSTPVTGAVLGSNRSNQPWLIVGTGTQYHTVQDHLKAKLAYAFGSTVRANYTFGLWQNKAQGRAESYLRDAAGNPFFTGSANINGRAYTITPSDFAQSREGLEHVMHALSVKSRTRGNFDWEVAASLYDYRRDLVRVPTGPLPAADTGGPGRLTDQKGTGWKTLAVKGIWRPAGEGGDHIVDFGVQQDSFRLRTLVSDASNWIAGDPTAFASRFDGNTRLRSVYAQDAWRFAERWKTVLGARVEHWTALGGVTQSAFAGPVDTGACNAGTDRCTVSHPPRAQTFTSPKAALSYQLAEDWVLKASTGRAIRFPTVSELYQGGVNAVGQTINNNPDLRPERSWTTELGSEWHLTAGSFRVTAFHEDTRDALYAQLNPATNANTVQNVKRIRTYGLETALQANNVVVKGIDAMASLTYADSRILENDGFVVVPGDTIGKLQPRVPRWRANLLVTWRADDRWATTLGARYSGPQFSTLDNSDPNGFAYQGASKFFTTDVRLRYQFDRHWSAAAGIDNLNNYKYWNFHPYPQRTFTAEVKFDY
jgi:iron complex outermembrane receptor protein